LSQSAPEREQSCSFTGHRPSKLPWGEDETDDACVKLKSLIYDAVIAVNDGGISHFICGMATGCDMYFSEAVLSLREERPGITLEAAIPFEGQAVKWSDRDKERHRRLTEACDYITVVQSGYSPDCMMRRNRYMVDNSSVLIAAYNGRKGGTMQTILYAMRQDLNIIELSIDSRGRL
jgi:uncharacterized phage-like protein YoqJ